MVNGDVCGDFELICGIKMEFSFLGGMGNILCTK